jgi:hypothetical protein
MSFALHADDGEAGIRVYTCPRCPEGDKYEFSSIGLILDSFKSKKGQAWRCPKCSSSSYHETLEKNVSFRKRKGYDFTVGQKVREWRVVADKENTGADSESAIVRKMSSMALGATQFGGSNDQTAASKRRLVKKDEVKKGKEILLCYGIKLISVEKSDRPATYVAV